MRLVRGQHVKKQTWRHANFQTLQEQCCTFDAGNWLLANKPSTTYCSDEPKKNYETLYFMVHIHISVRRLKCVYSLHTCWIIMYTAHEWMFFFRLHLCDKHDKLCPLVIHRHDLHTPALCCLSTVKSCNTFLPEANFTICLCHSDVGCISAHVCFTAERTNHFIPELSSFFSHAWCRFDLWFRTPWIKLRLDLDATYCRHVIFQWGGFSLELSICRNLKKVFVSDKVRYQSVLGCSQVDNR